MKCQSCGKITKLFAKKRQWIGEPTPDWPRYKYYCRECLDSPNPKRTAEPRADFCLVGIGHAQGMAVLAMLVGWFIFAIVGIFIILASFLKGN